MAKGFPYFKFIATEWLTGDIVYEELNIQGLFINICALYWQRDGKLSLEDINKRYKFNQLIDQLNGRFFEVENGFISISFLDEQLIEANHVSKINSENGKKGAEAKKNKAKAKRPLSEGSANFSKEKESKEEVNENKVKIRELVIISDVEHETLRKQFTEEQCNWMYDKLNNYKLSSGKKYKSDYGAINSWVKDELKKHTITNPIKKITKEL